MGKSIGNKEGYLELGHTLGYIFLSDYSRP